MKERENEEISVVLYPFNRSVTQTEVRFMNHAEMGRMMTQGIRPKCQYIPEV